MNRKRKAKQQKQIKIKMCKEEEEIKARGGLLLFCCFIGCFYRNFCFFLPFSEVVVFSLGFVVS